SNMIRLTVQRDDSIPGLARLRPASPLSPGFYVLHDGALIRGRQRKDVTTYFPFQIFGPQDADASSHQQVWFDNGIRCVDEITALVASNHTTEKRRGKEIARFDADTFVRAQGARIRRCATDLYAISGAATDPDIVSRTQSALATLDVVHNGIPSGDLTDLFDAIQPDRAGGALLSYWVDWHAMMWARELRRAIANG